MRASEDWLYEDEARAANESTLYGKIESLEKLVNPVRKRAFELEARETLSETIEKVSEYVNKTLAFVEKNMTWVGLTDRNGLRNMSTAFENWFDNVSAQQAEKALTEEPAFTKQQVHQRLHALQSEAERLTKMRKVEPYPYAGYGGYGGYGAGGYGGWNDPKMKAYYDELMKNLTNKTGNGTNSTFNASDYYEAFRKYQRDSASNGTNGTAGNSTGESEASAKANESKDEL